MSLMISPPPPNVGQENETTTITTTATATTTNSLLLVPQLENMGSTVDLPCFKDLIAVLFECFLIISLGYLSCRFKLISTEANDLNSYLTTFALPTIIFLNIAQMEFQTINYTFIVCMFAAKLLVLILVTVLTLTISYPRNYGYAGSLSILATQSNDFALGYPLIKSLYGEEKREMLNYLSLMAPIQLLIINPLGIILLEYEKSRRLKQQSQDEHNKSLPTCAICNTTRSDSGTCNNPRRSKLRRQSTGGTQVASSPLTVSNLPAVESAAQFNQGTLRKRSLSTTQKPDSKTTQVDGEASRDGVRFLGGLKHKNTKSLMLVIPARDNVIDTESENSIRSTAIGSKLVSCGQISPQTTFARPLSSPISYNNNECPEQLLTLSGIITNPQAPLGGQTPVTTRPSCSCRQDEQTEQGPVIGLSFLTALATNPLIIASVVALFVNLTHGPELPKLVTRVSNTVAA